MVLVFLPCPFSDFGSFLSSLGDGRFVALSASCVMEWNISLAIFLATKRVLCLEAIFSVSGLLAGAGWRKTALVSILFIWPSSIGVRPRRTCVCCCCRAGLLGQESLSE